MGIEGLPGMEYISIPGYFWIIFLKLDGNTAQVESYDAQYFEITSEYRIRMFNKDGEGYSNFVRHHIQSMSVS